MKNFVFKCKNEAVTELNFEDDTGLELIHLFGMPCETGTPTAWVKGLVSVYTERGTFLSKDTGIWSIEEQNSGFSVICTDQCTGLQLKSVWSFCKSTGVWSRKDSLLNISEKEITISRCLARFPFKAGEYETYSQGSSWCRESRGKWQKLTHGGLQLSCEGGRTTQGATPYLCIMETLRRCGTVFHIVPSGNWMIKASAKTAPGYSLPFAIVELGMADEYLHMNLMPGQLLELPEILIQELFDGQPQHSAPKLHEYLLGQKPVRPNFKIPVVYNTWFDVFDVLEPIRMERQLSAAKNVGCEVFTVDAGWYGAEEGDWGQQTGDWREKKDGAFYAEMLKFSDKVRAAGLGFGLWMEPERFCKIVPVLKEHPDWFINAGKGFYYLNLNKPEAVRYIKSEIYRLIDTYQLVWMKLDFNFDFSIDPYGTEFLWYFKAWYQLIEEIRQTRPGLFIEACSSGGMRLELSAQSHCDAHFLSDTVYPPDMLRIYEGSLLRLLPGRLTKWAVMRSAGQTVPVCGKSLEESPETVLVPCGATWERSESADIDFILFCAMSGVLGLSGDLSELSEQSKNRLRELISFYKKYRRQIYDSMAYLLTPITELSASIRWQVVQMHCQNQCDILFAYRLDDMQDEFTVKLEKLDESSLYGVEYWNGKQIFEAISGDKLMKSGITIKISQGNHATTIVIKKACVYE